MTTQKTARKEQVEKEKMERMMGFEPTTSTLARLRSTPELHPLWMTGCLAASVWQKIYMGIRIWQDFFREKSVFFPGSCLKITVCRVADGSLHIYQRHLEGRGEGSLLVQTIPISRRTLSAKCLSRPDCPRFSGGHERIGDSAWLLSRNTLIPRMVEIGIQGR